jgi:pantoate--beta-alanine ligase
LKQFQKISELQSYLKSTGKSIGFVPTMGALHEGHLALIQASKATCELSVCSIFVNPTQFNDPSDFEKYPITLEADLEKLKQVGCDVVFYPTVSEMYPHGTAHLKTYEIGFLETILEGKYRPGHFQGVCVVVDLLLQVVRPDQLFMGEKDYQQIAVVQKMLELTRSGVELVRCPTIRSAEGLALSSRNARLSEEQKVQALAIYKGFSLSTESAFKQSLLENGFKSIDYVACVDPQTLQEKPYGEKPCLILVAAFIGGVRLIDNKTLS